MTLLDEVRRFLAEDTRRRVTDTKPLFATAGAVDVALEFVRRVPERLEAAADRAQNEWTPDRFGDAFADLIDDARESADDAVRTLHQQGARLGDPAAVAGSARAAAEQALGQARRAPGRVAVSLAEQAGAALETYDDLAERGRTVFARLRGDAVPGETATSGRPGQQPPVFRRPTPPSPRPQDPPAPPAGPVIGHDVTDPGEPAGPLADTTAAPATNAAPVTSGSTDAAAPKKAAAPRKNAAPRKKAAPKNAAAPRKKAASKKKGTATEGTATKGTATKGTATPGGTRAMPGGETRPGRSS